MTVLIHMENINVKEADNYWRQLMICSINILLINMIVA